MASDAGLKKGDLVVKINDTLTENLPNEELRKIMRERYGDNIPYDELMISPGQLYDSPSLITVYSNEK